MAQHDYVIANGTGAAVRSDINGALAAIVSNNSGATEPTTTYAYMPWADTGSSPPVFKIRNAANNGWITLYELDGTFSVEAGSASSPGLYFTGDINTGIFSAGADQFNIATNGVERVEWGTSEVVFNDDGANYDFRIEGDTNSSLFFVDASAEAVGIGTTSPQCRLHVSNGGANGFEFFPDLETINSYNRSSSAFTPLNINAAQHIFLTSSTEAARIDSSRRLLVGTSSWSGTQRLNVTDGVDTTFTNLPTNVVLSNTGTIAAGLGAGINFNLSYSSGGVSTTYAAISGIRENATSGDSRGALVFGTRDSAGSTSMERMRITSVGRVGVGITSPNFLYSDAAGVQLDPLGYGLFNVNSNTGIFVNRKSDDGTLIELAQANTVEGSISVSGTTVSYNGAHLSRWSQLPGGAERTEILRGTVLSNIDEMCGWGEEDNEQLNRMKVSDVEGDPNVAGVFQGWDDDDDTYTDDFYCAMTGDFIIRIAEGVTVERGDLLMSAGDGTAKPQDDDIIRSKTVAKVTSTHVTCTYEDGSYCVPCVLMAC
jgi:hypothetical protein